HGPAPREAASALDVVVVALLVRRGFVLARLVAELAGGLVIVAHALLELLDRAAQVLGAAGQALGAEDQQHDREHDQPVPDAQTAHGLSRMYVGGKRRIAQPAASPPRAAVTGPAAAAPRWPDCLRSAPRPARTAAAAGRRARLRGPGGPGRASRGGRGPAAARRRGRARRGPARWPLP